LDNEENPVVARIRTKQTIFCHYDEIEVKPRLQSAIAKIWREYLLLLLDRQVKIG
jgi:hypothetical protein